MAFLGDQELFEPLRVTAVKEEIYNRAATSKGTMEGVSSRVNINIISLAHIIVGILIAAL